MQPSRLIVLAVVAAVGAAALVTVLQQVLSGNGGPSQRGLGGRLVATADLPAGHRLVASDVTAAADWKPQEGELASLTRAVEGRSLGNAVRKGQRIQDSDIAARGTGPALVSQIPAGSRAITVMLREAGPGVVLFQGATVDVLATVEISARSGPGRETVTRTIVEAVRVLAVNQESTGKAQDDSDRRSLPRRMTVTLLVTPAEATQIELASSKGTIGLTLRGEGDATPSGADAATSETLVGFDAGRTAAKPMEPRPAGTSGAVNPAAESPTTAPKPPPVWEVVVVKGSDTARHSFPDKSASPEASGSDKGGQTP